jgi:CDP-glucose 4,6-dehydratase
MFNNIYKGKKVIVTGHTGFKGSWLTTWLIDLGANVVGISNEIPTTPSMFEEIRLKEKITHCISDIRDLKEIEKIFKKEQPDFVFHLAAQAIVSTSYKDPVETITTNVIGTMNVLEALRGINKKCCVIMITSDKCYDNVEWVWGYKETDALGGKDVYSGSKGAAELIIKSYLKSFFSDTSQKIRITIARAGNVIGGGDWAKDRIIVDCVKAWDKGDAVQIRSPRATRPWQHVLEPLSGYLALGSSLHHDEKLHGEAFNFGPKSEQNRTVLDLLHDLATNWGFEDLDKAYQVVDEVPFNESELLKLNCDKALFYLKWRSTLSYPETVEYTADWYSSYYMSKHQNILEKTFEQITNYEQMALSQKQEWTN